MNYYIFFFSLAVLIALSLIISLKTKNEATYENFFLANKNIGFISLVFTLVATQLGGGAILGVCDEAYVAGPFACLYTLGQSLGLIVLSLGIGNRLRKLDIITLSEIFEKKFQAPILRRFASLISIISLSGILISMAVSSRSFIKALGIQNEYVLITFWLILVFYTTIGGLKAVISTDVMQAIILLTILFIVIIFAIYKNPSLIPKLTDFNLVNSFKIAKKKFSGWFLMPFLFTFIEQDLAQRFFAAKSSKVIFYASITAALILIISTVIPIFFGMVASLENISVTKNNSIFIKSIISTTNPLISALSACAVLAAIISTADSILVAISSNICNDFDIFKKNKNIIFPKIITAFIGILVLIISFYFNNIISILIKSYEISICCTLIPTIMATFNMVKKSRSAYGSVFFGLFAFIFFSFININFSSQILSIIFSLIGYIIFSL